MLFKVLAGRHTAAGIVYSKDDVIESDQDLVALFGDNKFQRDLEAEMKKASPVSKPTADPVQKTTKKTSDVKKPKDVTDQFQSAVDNDLIVTKIGKKFFIAEKATPNDHLHDDSLKKSEVEDFIEELYEAD